MFYLNLNKSINIVSYLLSTCGFMLRGVKFLMKLLDGRRAQTINSLISVVAVQFHLIYMYITQHNPEVGRE